MLFLTSKPWHVLMPLPEVFSLRWPTLAHPFPWLLLILPVSTQTWFFPRPPFQMSLRVKGFSDSIPISFCVHPNLSFSSLQLWEEGSKWTGSLCGLSPYCQLQAQAWHTESSQSSFISEWMKKWMDVTLYSKVTEITKVIPALFIFNPCAPE